MEGHAVNNFVQGYARAKAGESFELFDAGDAAHHVFEAGFIGLVIRNVLDGRRAGGALLHTMGQVFDADFLRIPDVHYFSDGARSLHEAKQALDGVAHVAEAARLFAVAINGDRRILESRLDEIGEHHAVASGLPWTYSVEQTRDNDGKLLFLPVREREKLIERFRRGVAPAAL